MKRYRQLTPMLIRRLLCIVVALGICAMLMPLPFGPLQPDPTEKDRSQPFPCQNRPCGCRSAEQCWKKCCCFNNSQKIAWAKANKVAVPDYVLAASQKEPTNVEVCCLPSQKTASDVARQSKSRCSQCEQRGVATGNQASGTVCSHSDRQTSKVKECCERQPTFTGSVASENAASGASHMLGRPSKLVMAVYSAQCQGQGPHVYCSIVLIMPGSQLLKPASPQMIEKISLESERLLPASLRPPVPPPKIDQLLVAAWS
jgi:hypothetical protein